jgi:hypothetical protein
MANLCDGKSGGAARRSPWTEREDSEGRGDGSEQDMACNMFRKERRSLRGYLARSRNEQTDSKQTWGALGLLHDANHAASRSPRSLAFNQG